MSVAALRNLEELNPQAVRLAESVAFAIMIDRAFLRAARIALVPGADAGTEADLWFSPVVQSRTGDGIVLDPEVAEELRRRMSPQRLEEVWSVTSREHAWLAPSLRLEEEVAYLSVSREPTAREQLADRLRSVLAAMAGGERAGLAQWAVRALAMFPSAVQTLPEARMLDTGTRLRLGRTIEAEGAETPFPDWLPWIAPASLGSVALDFDLREEQLEIRTASGDGQLNVPATNPLLLEVSWEEDESRRRQSRQITFRKGETVTVSVGRGEVRLRTITGEEYDLREQDYVPARLREEIIDFSAEMERHAEVIGREQEIDAILAQSERQSSIVITAEQGFGKTAFLCELIREANRRGIPCVQHFFRFGDYRLESLSSAERSLVAQLIARFGLPESMFGLRLPEVLQRLQLQKTPPERLLIVIDDIDEARNAEREVVENAFVEWFKVEPRPAIGCLIASATKPQPWPEENHALQAPDKQALSEYLQPLKRLDLMVRSMPNFAEIKWIAANPQPDAIQKVLESDPLVRKAITAAAVALRPLNGNVFEQNIEAHLHDFLSNSFFFFLRGGDVEVEINDFFRARVLEVINDEERAEAHRRLVRALESSREVESVDRYYLLNAPWHLRQAGDFDEAEALCTSFSFMTQKIEKVGVSALIADFVMVRPIVEMLRLNAAALQESPKDLPAILLGTFASMGWADRLTDQLPLVPRLVIANDHTNRQPRKHHGPIRGSTLAAAGVDAFVTWSDDGTVKTWPNDASIPVTLEHSAAVVAFEMDFPDEAWSADANGFLYHWRMPEGRCMSRIVAHDGPIDGMLADFKNSLIVTWSGRDPIRLWTWVMTGRIVPFGELAGHGDVVAGCSFMQDDNLLLSASRDKTCRLWNVSVKAQIGMVTLSAPATRMAAHLDSYSSSRFVMTDTRMLDLVQVEESGIAISQRAIDTGHDLPVSGVAISESRLIATYSEDQTVRLWDLRTVSLLRSILREQRAAVTTCRFASQSGTLLVTGAADGTAIVWDTQTSRIVSRFEGHQRAIRTIATRGATVYTAGDDGVVLEWAAPTGTLLADRSKVRGRVAECAVQASGDRAVITDGDTQASLIRLPEGEVVQTWGLDPPRLARSSGRDLVVYSADGSQGGYRIKGEDVTSFSPGSLDGNFIMAAAIADDGISAFGTSGGAVTFESYFGTERLQSHEGRVSALAFSDPLRLVVSAGYDGMLNISDIKTGGALHSIRAHHSRILALAVSSTRAVTGSAGGTLRVWDLVSGQAVTTIRDAHDAEITGCDFAGDLIVTRSLDGTIRIHSDSRPTVICRGHRDTITRVAIALPERVLYSCSEDRTIRRWDIDTGEQTGIIYGSAPFRCIAWAGGTLLAGDDGGNLWTVGQPKSRPKPSVFIVNTSRDDSFARRLYNDLLGKNISTWFAPEDLKIGDQFRSRIDEAVRSHDKVVLILSVNSVGSDWVEAEVESALERERKEQKDVLFPIAIDEAGFNSKQGWAADLRRKRHIADFRNWKSQDDYAAAFERLVRDLKKSQRYDERWDSPH